MGGYRAWSCVQFTWIWACVVMFRFAIPGIDPGMPGAAVAASVHERAQTYRDFLIKIPAKDYRKKYGKESYRYPKMKVVVILHPSGAAEAVLANIMKAVNIHRHEVDVVFYYPQLNSSVMRAEPLVGCRHMIFIDSTHWRDVKDLLLEHDYDTLVSIPSELSDIDDQIMRMAMQGTNKLAKQTVLVSSRHFAHSVGQRWTAYSSFFDFSVFWGKSWKFSLLMSELHSTLQDKFHSCKVLITEEDQRFLNNSFINKLFLTVQRLEQLLQSSALINGNDPLNLDLIELLQPSAVFLNHRVKVYVRASYGWDVLSWDSQPHRKFAEIFYEILRVPVGYFLPAKVSETAIEVADFLSTAGGQKMTDWSTPCEERLYNSGGLESFFHYTHEVDEICDVGKRPVLAHPDLLVSQRYIAYTAPNAMDHILQVWRENDWRNVVADMIATLNYEIIDQFALAKSVEQLFVRHLRPPLPEATDIIALRGPADVSWAPPLGRASPSSFGGYALHDTILLDIFAVNTDDRALVCRDDNNTWFVAPYENMHIPLDLREGDDFGIMSDNLALQYNLDSSIFLSTVLLSGEIGDMGSSSAVRSRRPKVPLWLQGDTDVVNDNTSICKPTMPDMGWVYSSEYNPEVLSWQLDHRCNRSLLSKKLNISIIRPCDIDSNRNGSYFHHRNVDIDVDIGDANKNSPLTNSSPSSTASFTIAMTTCRRLGHFLEVAENIESFVFTFSTHLVTEVVVVDDMSSVEDRLAMLSAFPDFTFIFKSWHSRGHAASLNMIVRHISSRFFMYLEDDWRLLPKPFLSPALSASANSHISPHGDQDSTTLLHGLIRMAIRVIQDSLGYHNESHDHEPVAQVFLNDQRSRFCAVGLLGLEAECGQDTICRCDEEDVGSGGWLRHTKSSRASSSLPIPYSLHEFGILYETWGERLHGHALWPGLGLNPAVWDMTQIMLAWRSWLPCDAATDFGHPSLVSIEDSLYSNIYFRNNINYRKMFDESDEAFEHIFSLMGYVTGLNTAFLPAVTFRHIGDVSAYSLNNFSRPWDDVQYH